jgi:hypothetical protein
MGIPSDLPSTPKGAVMAQHEIRDDLLAAVGSGVLEYASEIARRLRVDRAVEVLEVDDGAVAPGSMVVLVGSESALAGLRSDLRDLGAALAPKQRSGDGGIAALPVLSEVSYRGKVVAAGLAVQDAADVAAAQLLFAGGKIDRGNLVVTHFHRPDARELADQLSSLVIVRQPQLSEVEQALLGRLDECDLNAAVAPPYATTIFVVAIDLTSGKMPYQDPALARLVSKRLPELDAQVQEWLQAPEHMRELEELDARAAVEALVQLRARLLTKSG